MTDTLAPMPRIYRFVWVAEVLLYSSAAYLSMRWLLA